MGGFADRIYHASPVWLQNAGVATWGLWWYWRRFGRVFHREVREIRSREAWDGERFVRYQQDRLRELLRKAGASPYYREVFQRAGVRLDEDPFAILRKIPLLTKQALRERGRDLLTKEPGRDVMVFRSSGTTGTPTELFFGRDFHQRVQAYFEARNRNWAGVTYRDRRAMFGVRKICRPDETAPPFWRRSPVENLAYFSIYHLSPRLMPHYVEYLQRFRPSVIMGYPNSLNTLAKFVLDEGYVLAAAKAIITTSETVTPEIRSTLEAAFRAKLFDQYCAVEACVLATQCENGRYHVSPDFAVLEILDEKGDPCPPGRVGRAVCTGLNNLVQPLIRYEIGDAVAWSEETSCPCGRDMPMIRSIEGRIEDMCYTVDGRAVLRFDTVFKGISAIEEGQVVQEALDHFVIKVVPTKRFSDEDRQTLVKNMRIHVGDVRTDVVEVDAIPRTRAGKFRPVISKVERPPAA